MQGLRIGLQLYVWADFMFGLVCKYFMAAIAIMKCFHAMANIKSIFKQSPYYSNHIPHINLNLKPYHNLNPNPNSLEKLRPEQVSREQMSCHPYLCQNLLIWKGVLSV